MQHKSKVETPRQRRPPRKNSASSFAPATNRRRPPFPPLFSREPAREEEKEWPRVNLILCVYTHITHTSFTHTHTYTHTHTHTHTHAHTHTQGPRGR